MTEEIKAVPAEYQPPESCEGFLVDCLRESLNQARHVENERMLFVSLFAALTGGVLAVASQMPNAGKLPCLLMGVLIFLNLLCTVLVCRWNKVYSGHMRIAKSIYTQILSPAEPDSPQLPENKYYYFENSYDAEQNKLKENYIKTGTMFIIYNCAVLLILLLVLRYFWVQAPPF